MQYFMGFFCGFPMGAKVVSDLFEKIESVNQKQRHSLLFAIISDQLISWGLLFLYYMNADIKTQYRLYLGMYGIPALYGIILGRIYCKKTKIIHTDVLNHNFESPKLSLAATLKNRVLTIHKHSLFLAVI